MSDIKGHPVEDVERVFLSDMWEIIRLYKNRVEPMPMLAMAAQLMGAIMFAGQITNLSDDELDELIALNLKHGFECMEKAFQEAEDQ